MELFVTFHRPFYIGIEPLHQSLFGDENLEPPETSLPGL
jgi:hypothetical protein